MDLSGDGIIAFRRAFDLPFPALRLCLRCAIHHPTRPSLSRLQSLICPNIIVRASAMPTAPLQFLFASTPRAAVGCWLVAATLVVGWPGLAEGSTVDAEVVAELLAEVERVPTALSLAPLTEAIALSRSGTAVDLEAWHRIAAEHPYVETRALAQYALLRWSLERLDLDEVIAAERSMGFVTAWSVIGPFANDGMSGLAVAYGPEHVGVDSEARFQGRLVEVGWSSFDRATETGYLDLAQLIAPHVTSVAYAASTVTLTEPLDGELRMAVDGAYRIWVNGMPLVEQPDHLGGFFMRDTIPLRLDAGEHELLVKFATTDSPMGGHFRLVDAMGSPISFDARPSRSAPAVEPVDAESWPQPITYRDVFAPLIEDLGTSAEDLSRAAYVLRRLQPDDPTLPWSAFRDRAMETAGGASTLRRLAATADTSWHRESLLERAAIAPDRPYERLLLAQAKLDSLGLSRAVEGAIEVNALVESYPNFVAARVEQARTARRLGLHFSSFSLLHAAWESFPEDVGLRVELTRAATLMNRDDLVQILAASFSDAGGVDAEIARFHASTSVNAGRLDDAIARLERVRALLPANPRVLAIQALAYVAAGQLDDARASLEEAIEMCPTCPTYRAALTDVLVREGNTDGARLALEEAVAREPQNAHYRAYLDELSVRRDRFYTPYTISAEEIDALMPDEAPQDLDYTTLVDQRVVHVFSNGLASTYTQQAFHVHTRSGADMLRVTNLAYSPDAESVEVIRASVTKPDGSRRELFDTRDFGPPSGPAAMYFDVRTRSIAFQNVEPGDVLQLEYVISDIAYRNIFDDYFGDIWFAQDFRPRVFGRYVVSVPETRTLYINTDATQLGTWSEQHEDARVTHVYEVRDAPRVRREDGLPGASEIAEYVSVSTYGSWDALSDWYWSLVRDQLVTSPDIIATVHDLIDGLEDPRDQVAAIYGYVVRNTRYVGLEFGIHGYKPYRTTDCFNRRFGDCKDTASLIKVMLDVAGIDAYLVLVRTRDRGRVAPSPASLAVFNHAIVYVPSVDLYLDGTAGFSGSAELPSADQGASAVIVRDGNGGEFVTIPFLDPDASLSETVIRVDLSNDPTAGTGEILRTGAFAPSMRQSFEAGERRAERIGDMLSRQIPGVEVSDVVFNDLTEIEEPVTVSFNLQGGEWLRTQPDGDILYPFASPSTLVRRLAGTAERHGPLRFDFLYALRETYVISLGDNATLDRVPTDVARESPFGAFSVSYQFEDGTLTSELWFELHTTQIEASDYPAFREFVGAAETAINRVVRPTRGASP